MRVPILKATAMRNTNQRRSEEYNSEPVAYCPKCYSLQIGYIDGVENSDYCMNCGCSETAVTSIGEWEELYRKRYGHSFVERKHNPELQRLNRMDMSELKQELFDNARCMSIIREMYPGFPKYLSRTDSVIMFFDKICKDRRIDELKDYLIRNS